MALEVFLGCWWDLRCIVKSIRWKNVCLAGRSSVPCSWAGQVEPMLCPVPLLALKGFPSCPCDGQLAWGRPSPQAWPQSRRSLCAFRLSFKWWEQQTIRQLSFHYLPLRPWSGFWWLNMRCDMHIETLTCILGFIKAGNLLISPINAMTIHWV